MTFLEPVKFLMNNKPLLICTDLDRTLIPNGIQAESSLSRRLFSFLSKNDFIRLAYVTGRDIKLVNKAINSYQLPIPDYIISDVGASLYQSIDNQNPKQLQWQYMIEWENSYKQDWGGHKSSDLSVFFSDISELRKQEITKQKDYKLSYYLPLYVKHQLIIDKMKQRLSEENIKAEFIWSIDAPNSIGLLDVMPEHATKKNAIEYLMKFVGFSYDNTIFSGDSGNDLDVLYSQIKSTLVANAHPDIKQEIEQFLLNDTHNSNIYIAQGNFLNMNGNYSAGILEGICHYFPDYLPFLENQLMAIHHDSK